MLSSLFTLLSEERIRFSRISLQIRAHTLLERFFAQFSQREESPASVNYENGGFKINVNKYFQ